MSSPLKRTKPSLRSQKLISPLPVPHQTGSSLVKLKNKFLNLKLVIKVRVWFNRLPRKVQRAIYFFLLFTTVFTSFAVYLTFKAPAAEAAWFNDNWGYRHKVEFTHNADITSDRAITFTLDTAELISASLMQSDCDDTRFTDPSGNILKFDLTGTCNNASTTYEVILPKVFNGSNFFYVYYGNPSAINTEIDSASYTALTPSGGDPSLTNPTSSGNQEKAPSAVAYWKFDDGQGITAQDTSANNFDATLTSMSSTPSPTSGWQNEDQCLIGKCVRLDGSNDFVDTTANTTFDATANYLTIGFWLKVPSTVALYQGLISKGGSGTAGKGGWAIGYESTNKLTVVFKTSSGTNGITAVSLADVPLNIWTYYTVIIKMDTSVAANNDIQIYSNGKLDQNGMDKSTAPQASVAKLKLGVRGEDGSETNFLNGTLDDVKIYSYQRSSAQILADYNARQNPEGLSSRSGNNTQNMPQALSNGLTGYWKMDESSWTNNCSSTSVADSSGNGNNGKACPNSTGPTGGSTGKFGNGGLFDGSNDNIQVTNTASLNTASFSVSGWFNPSTNQIQGLITKNDQAQSWRLYMDTSSGSIQFDAKNDTINLTTEGVLNLSTGVWSHVVATYDTSTSKMSIYVNGTLIASQTAADLGNTNPSNLIIGAINATPSSPFSGSIDEVRTYNRALSSSEVAQLYNWAPGPVAYWKFDEGSGTSLVDSSGNANAGTITAGSGRYVGGKYGKSYNFDGDLTYVDAGSASVIDDLLASSYSAWIYPRGDGETSQGRIFDKSWTLRMAATNSIAFTASFPTSQTLTRITSGGITTNAWNFVEVTWDGSGTASNVHIYINGVEPSYATTTNVTGSKVSDASTTLGIGNRSSQDRAFNGYIDEAKIYNYERTKAQIIEDMNAGHPAPGSPVGTPVGHWRMDEGYSDTANNSGNAGSGINLDLASSSNTCPGHTSCPSWTNDGKFGKALNLDGTNDYAQIPSTAALNFTASASYTWTTWVQVDSLPNTGSPLCNAIPIYSKSNTTKGFSLGLEKSTGKLLFFDYDASPTCYVSTTGLTVGSSWYHLAYVYSNGSVNFYLNGQPLGSGSSGTYLDDATSAVIVGASGADNNNREPFDGRIDELKYYTQALTADQIKTDMNQGKTEVLGALSSSSNQPNSATNEYCVPGEGVTCSAPVGRWDFDEGSGQTVSDQSGNNNSGTLGANSSSSSDDPSWVNGKVNKSLRLDGTADYVNISDSSSLDLGTNFTIEVWIKPIAIDSTIRGILCKDTGGGGEPSACSYYLEFNAGNTLDFFITDSGGSTCGPNSLAGAMVANAWNHIAGTYDGTKMKLYTNGVQGPGIEASCSSTPFNSSGPLRIGQQKSGFNRFFNGDIDQVRIFNYARTPAQIAQDYNKGGPVAWYKMDECQGTSLGDASGNSNTGTITIGGTGTYTSAGTCTSGTATHAWFGGVTGKRNYSLALDGTNDYAQASDSTSLSPPYVTVSAWVNPSSAISTNKVILSKRTAFGSADSFVLWVRGTTAKPAFAVSTNGTSETNIDASSTALASGTWYHLVGVYDQSTVKIYINGKLEGSTAKTGTLFDSTAKLNIGSGADGSASESWPGSLDDIRIYNYPLTSTQIKTIYNDGATRYGPVTGAP